jgi:hypothetical protein
MKNGYGPWLTATHGRSIQLGHEPKRIGLRARGSLACPHRRERRSWKCHRWL